jgi:hypothetical protein
MRLSKPPSILSLCELAFPHIHVHDSSLLLSTQVYFCCMYLHLKNAPPYSLVNSIDACTAMCEFAGIIDGSVLSDVRSSVRCRRPLGLGNQPAERMALRNYSLSMFTQGTQFGSQIWRTHWTPVKIAYLFCRSARVHDHSCYVDKMSTP